MAEYIEVNGRQIRVRPTETVSEVDKYGNFHRQPNHFTKGFGPGDQSSIMQTIWNFDNGRFIWLLSFCLR